MPEEYLGLKEIIVDKEVQPRVQLDSKALEEYTGAIKEGVELPPVEVFKTEDGYILADGFHRHRAHELAGKRKINANIHEGTRRDAILYAIQANQQHGVRLSNEDKRKMALMFLRDDEWTQWSDNEISKHVGATQPFVGKIRKELIAAGELDADGKRIYKRGGKTVTQDTAKLVKTRQENQERKEAFKPEEPEEKPEETTDDQLNEPEVTTVEPGQQYELLPEVIPVENQQGISPDKLLMLSSPKYGDVYHAGQHTLYFGAVNKVLKKLTEFDYCLWLDTLSRLKENASWLFDHVAIVTYVASKGEEVRSFDDIGLTWQSGTLLNNNGRTYYLGHFSVDQVAMPDFSVNDWSLIVANCLDVFTTPHNNVLIVAPQFEVLQTTHSKDRIATIVSTDADYTQAELVGWEKRFGSKMPIEKTK